VEARFCYLDAPWKIVRVKTPRKILESLKEVEEGEE